MNKYLALDIESGGLQKETSLLTAYFEVLDEYLHPVDSLDLAIKHDLYQIEPSALTVNHIDLVKHDQIAEYKSTAGQKLWNFLKKHSDDGKNKLTPLGHGIFYDMPKIYDQLMNKGHIEQYLSYRMIDTGAVALFLRDLGLIPQEVSGSLESLAKHFNIVIVSDIDWPIHPNYYTVIEGHLHTAKTDTKVTIQVYRQQLRLLTNRLSSTG